MVATRATLGTRLLRRAMSGLGCLPAPLLARFAALAPFALQLTRADFEELIHALRALEALPTVRRGLDALGMEDLFEWFWRGDEIRQAGTPFAHPLQRPYVFVPGLRARPFWEPDAFEWTARLARHVDVIQAELAAVLEEGGGFQPYRTIESKEWVRAGYGRGSTPDEPSDWNMFYFYLMGRRVEENCARCPRTAELLESIPRLERDNGILCFSALNPGTFIDAHCGPRNTILRAHLGLRHLEGATIRVGNEIRTWREGEWLVLDDSFDHQVWHRGDHTRVILFVDVWHPDWQDDELETASMLRAPRDFARAIDGLRASDRSLLAERRWWR